MVELILPPDPHALLPHLLACLPTAFASSRPPPALLPLLSPILRQRLQIIPSTATGHDNWLRLLCWDNNKAERLKDVVENANFEPHPSSGELELGDVDSTLYKRADEETLRSNIGVPDYGLNAVYLWCSGDEDGSGWKLAELLPYENATHIDESWSRTISDANASSRERLVDEALNKAQTADRLAPTKVDDDDDYWAQYDTTPGRSPAIKRSPAPPNGGPSNEMEYYDQYGDVQPEMDNEGDNHEIDGMGESTLNGNSLTNILSNHTEIEDNQSPPAYHFPSNHVTDVMDEDDAVAVTQPHPGSPSTNGSDIVARLEETAERNAASEFGIKQHISTSIKSMYRLAKSAGIDKEEFERIVSRELETLAILDRED
jgi:hypothetical protein